MRLVPKFLLVFVPSFPVMAGIGISQLMRYDVRVETEKLAARVGNQTARATAALARQDAFGNPELALDVLSPLTADAAVECGELRTPGTAPGSVVPSLGCVDPSVSPYAITLPVDGPVQSELTVRFTDAELATEARTRRIIMLAVLALATAVSVFSAGLGLRLVVGRRFGQLNSALARIAEGGDRVAVDPGAPDELGALMASFNAMIESERRREQALERSLEQRRQIQSELEQVNAELQEWIRAGVSERRFRDFAASSSDWYWEMNADLRFTYFSDRFTEVTGVPNEALLGKTRRETGIPGVDREVRERHLDDLASRRPFRAFEHPRQKPSGETVWLSINGTPVFDGDGRFQGYRGTGADVTEQRNAESRIRSLAQYDPVTGLPNRVLLAEQLERAIDVAARYGRTLAVLFVDLDHFKRINDTRGHSVGDEVLREVAHRLSSTLRAGDLASRIAPRAEEPGATDHTVARLGGDEFVVVLREVRSADDAAAIAQRIKETLAAPFTVHATTVYVTTSIGISVFPDDAGSADDLLKHADAAMYEANGAGRDDFRFYTRAMQGHAYARLRTEAALRRALEEGAFVLDYQPRIDLRTGRAVGMEALLRWTDPELGVVSPVDFIPVAEETGLIVPLGAWVLETACRQTRRWHEAGFHGLCVSVNVSVVQVQQDDLVARVAAALEETGLEPGCLELELTEGLLMDDTHAHIEPMDALKALGVRLSIDDFGTGYSSLQYLKRFPIDALKIDRGFVRDLETDLDDTAIVRGTIGLAHSLRLRVVAEGVETPGQSKLLRDLECDEVQGYHFSRPLDADAFAAWLSEWRDGDPGEAFTAFR